LPLEEAVLGSSVKKTCKEEDESRPRVVDTSAFSLLLGKASLKAANLITAKPEDSKWQEVGGREELYKGCADQESFNGLTQQD
jgi:hypothetical protein